MKQIVIISGCSGAGKSVAARALEDIGFFVVDNLPPQFLNKLLELDNKDQIALVIDARDTNNINLLPEIWEQLDTKQYKKHLIFLDASEKKIIERYQETKRKHPLDTGQGIRRALVEEEILLSKIKKLSTRVIFTDKYTNYELKNYITTQIGTGRELLFGISLLSFGFKHGIPEELDLCFDVRFLKNPFYDSNLKNLSGLNRLVYDFVLEESQARVFLDKIQDILEYLIPLYKKEGKSRLTIAFGCTGGQHRSVVIVEVLKKHLSSIVENIQVTHRELEKMEYFHARSINRIKTNFSRFTKNHS